MSNEKKFSYLLVAALAASFSTDAAAQEPATDLYDLDKDGEWRPTTDDGPAETSAMIETRHGWGVEIDRVRFHGEDFDVELQARGRLNDVQLVLRPDDRASAPEVREVANWLNHSLSAGDRLHRRMNEWSFEGRLYAPGIDGHPGKRSIEISGELPLEVEVARNDDDPSVVVEVGVPDEVFELDWKEFRDRLKG